MTENSNLERDWPADLRSAEHDAALEALRRLLLRGLHFAIRERYHLTDADLEDFVQDALLKILHNLDSFRGESRFTTWATKIAVRVALSELRRRRWQDVTLHDLLPSDAAHAEFSIAADSAPSPEQQATQQSLLTLVQNAIRDALTTKQRQAMMAIVFGGMPLEEVARRMGSNRNALYKLLHDARKRLKAHLLAQDLSPQDILAAFETPQ